MPPLHLALTTALVVLTAAALLVVGARGGRAGRTTRYAGPVLDARTQLPTVGHLTAELALTPARARRLHLLLVRVEPLREMLRALPPGSAAQLLAVLSSRVAEVAGPRATVGRADEDEFVVLTDADGDALGRALLVALREPLPLDGAATVEVRPAVAAVGGFDDPDLTVAVDRARYALARRADVDGLKRYDHAMAAEQERTTAVTAALATAVATGAVEPWFQPIVEVRTGEITGFELLARWFDEALGPVAPAEFIPIAEATGIITDLGRRLITAAVVQLARWRHLPRCADLYLTVNLSARQLQNRPERWLLPALAASGLPPTALVVELTEGAFVDVRDEEVAATLAALRTAGVRLAIDDFGTGYSSLAYLQQFRPDIVKVDRSFTARLGRGDDAVAAGVFTMVRDLGWEVVAEGIEEAATVDALASLACRYGQGWLWSPAVRADDATELLVQQRVRS